MVTIVGTTRGALASEKGEYAIRAVAPGVITLRATRIGYAAITQTVTVPESGTITADFALTSTPSKLDEIVVSATGAEETKRQQPVSIGTINMDSVNLAPVNSFSGAAHRTHAGCGRDVRRRHARRRHAHPHSRIEFRVA